MLSVDPAFLAALAGGHQPIARLTSLDSSGAVRETWEGRVGSRRAVLNGGSVGYDRSSSIRRRCSLELANPTGSLTPKMPGDFFFGGEAIAVERGIVIGGQAIYQPLFAGVVSGFAAGMDGHLSVTGEDRLTLLAQPYGDVTAVTVGTSAADALVALWGPVLGDTSGWLLDDAGRTVPDRAWTADDDRLTTVWQLMADLGLEVFSDRRGEVVLRPIPDPTSAVAVRTITRLPGQAAMLTATRSGSRLPYNRVVVIAEHEDGTVIRAQADVTDATSPIHAGRIGLRTAPIYRSAQIPDQAAANAVANAKLVEYALVSDALAGDFVPDLTLDEEDVISLDEPVSGLGDRYIIDQATHPVVSGPMSVNATRVVAVFS